MTNDLLPDACAAARRAGRPRSKIIAHARASYTKEGQTIAWRERKRRLRETAANEKARLSLGAEAGRNPRSLGGARIDMRASRDWLSALIQVNGSRLALLTLLGVSVVLLP